MNCWRFRVWRAAAGAVPALAIAHAAYAGPPFLTDDPDPTELGHWEIYGPALEASGRGRDYEGSAGVELNYGAAPDVQVTLGLPVNFAHSTSGFERGVGDLELSVKYRFFHSEAAGLSIAAFPGLTVPTASHGLGAGTVTGLLPVWAQKDVGPWSLFGGGGYAINPGAGNRNYWTGGVALARQVSDQLRLGGEINRQGAGSAFDQPTTSLGIAAIIDVEAPFRILGSVGPTFVDGGGPTDFHAYVGLGLNF